METTKRNALTFEQKVTIEYSVYLKSELTEEQEKKIDKFIERNEPTNFDDIGEFISNLLGKENIVSFDENEAETNEIEFTDVYFEKTIAKHDKD